MKTFIYEAIREPGRSVSGQIDAEERSAAASALIARGYHVIRIEDAESAAGLGFAYRFGVLTGFRRRDLVRFSRDLAALLRAGLPLVQSLSRLRTRETRKRWRNVLAGIQSVLEEGSTFSDALAHYPGLFEPMYVNLVRAGEEGGTVAETLQRLADLSERREELRSKVSLALVYPLIMLGVGAVTVIVLLTLVVPMFTEVFEQMGQSLPWPTRFLVSSSRMMTSWWWLIVVLVALAGFGVGRFLAQPMGMRLRDSMVLVIPRLGKVASMAEIGTFTRTLGTLLRNGVPMGRALEVTAATLKNQYFKDDVMAMESTVRDGDALSNALSETRNFPESMASVLAVGEDSGTLAETLLQVAEDYDRDLERELKVLATLIEPMMILLVGAAVGFIVAAIVLPIFDLGDLAEL